MPNREQLYDAFEMEEFELDFATACNMMLGKTYDESVKEARKWIAEAKE